MNHKLEIEPEVKEIVHDFSVQYMIQQELQDIYNCLDKIKEFPIIIYKSQQELESLEEDKLKEELNQEEVCYENI